MFTGNICEVDDLKRARIGGQAVIEGVMMKYGDQYAVAVRKPDQEIEVKIEPRETYFEINTINIE